MLTKHPEKIPVRFRHVLNFNWLVHILLKNVVGKIFTSMTSLIFIYIIYTGLWAYCKFSDIKL